MAAHPQMSVEEYLRTSFEVDCDYVDGEVVERNEGEMPHSETMTDLMGLLYNLGKKLSFHVYPVLRMRLAATRYRVADIAVFAGEKPTERFPSQPPLIAIEILSRDNRYSDVLSKLEDYRAWGVRHIWFVDPALRKIHVYSAATLTEVPAFQIPEYNVEISAAEIFA